MINEWHNPMQTSFVQVSGSEDFDRLRPLSYEGASVFVLCFDLTDAHTLDFWIAELLYAEIRHFDSMAPILLVGLKKDKRDTVLKKFMKAMKSVIQLLQKNM